jgi:prepilin-type N-terminal cleavage/methylation domain-containing protein/prepilin-type processing-associated H-X9-DG protein
VERRPWLRSVGGFTLTELMVVIALVSLLTGLLFSGLRLVREKANQIKCMSNLQSLGLAVQMYADQHDGLFPEVTDLEKVPLQVQQALLPYAKSEEIFCCPVDPNKPTPPGGSYDWRVTHDPKTTLSGVRLDLIRHPNRVIIAGERVPDIHKQGMINVLYADGHVDQVTVKEWFRNITTPLEVL